MQAVLCDICERPIWGKAFEFHILRGEAVETETGRPRIIQREGSMFMYMCDPYCHWIQEALAHLRLSHGLAKQTSQSVTRDAA